MHPLLSTVSTDPEYGYTKEKPVKLGPMGQMLGPSASRHYLKALRTKNGRAFEFRRNGSVGEGADGHVIDHYFLTSRPGEDIGIYIDMYHPENDPDFQAAPVGMTKGSPNLYEKDLKAEPPRPAKSWWQFWK